MYNIALFGAGRIGQVHAVNIAEHKETVSVHQAPIDRKSVTLST